MRFLTAGESHGPGLTVIIEGLPAGFQLSIDELNRELARRQQGYGRGARMQIESDQVQVYSGLRAGRTLGSPLTLHIANRDYANWKPFTHPLAVSEPGREIICPRPGHADFAGGFKYGFADLRDVADRASARETAARVAVGGVAKQMLAALAITIRSRVIAIGEVGMGADAPWDEAAVEACPLRCGEAEISREMIAAIDAAAERGDSWGGAFQLEARGVPIGLGSVMHWDRRLDGLIAQALISIPAIKGLEFGQGIWQSRVPGSQAQDQLYWTDNGPRRETNWAGGLEGGMSNGEPISVVCYMKPIPSIAQPLSSFHWLTRTSAMASRERADTCAVPAASIVGEAVMAITLLQVLLEQVGGDRWQQVVERVEALREWC
ncbi:MAG: chorismate synthase [Firmicutes bacterium]|nr:chorismate synthase [Bacillota bacterium]